jgi:hypothetical protein
LVAVDHVNHHLAKVDECQQAGVEMNIESNLDLYLFLDEVEGGCEVGDSGMSSRIAPIVHLIIDG